jgi:hypothetical protein
VILSIVREAWAQSPARVVGSVIAAPFVVAAAWVVLVVAIVAGTPA